MASPLADRALHVGLAYTLRNPASAGDADANFEDQATIDAPAAALEQAGHRLTRLPFDDELLERLGLVFNICEGRVGRSRE